MPVECGFCNRVMEKGTTCYENKLIEFEDGERLEPVRVGQRADWTENTCHDCNAPAGGTHHPGCDTERCPRCGGQLISCRCDVKQDILVQTND